MPTPSVGRLVHFRVSASEVRPAIIVKTWDNGVVNLEVFGPESYSAPMPQGRHPTSVRFDETGAEDRTWCWPPRVE